MLKSRLNLATLLALAAMGAAPDAAAAGANIKRTRSSVGPRGGNGRSRGHSYRVGGKRYPEQSSGQALRGLRRAQGGPGIVLVGGKYQPREAA